MVTVPPALESLIFRAALGLPPALQRLLVRRPIVRDGQVLATEVQLMLELEQLARVPVVEELPLEQGRRELTHQAKIVGGRQSVGALRDLVVDGADGDLARELDV